MQGYFDDTIKLRSVTPTIVNGFSAGTAIETEVFADRKSVARTEYYKALRSGIKADLIFEISANEYGGQTEIAYDGNIYDVVRTYQVDIDKMSLTVARRTT